MKIALGKDVEVDGQELITGRTLLCSVTRYGKCLDGGSLVALPNGGMEKLSDLVKLSKTSVLSYGAGTVGSDRVLLHHEMKPTNEEYLHIFTAQGHDITASPDHHFLTKDGWIKASELKVGIKVATDFRKDFGDLAMPDHELKLIAYLIAEGSLTKGIGFTNTNSAMRNEFLEALHEFDPNTNVSERWPTIWIYSKSKGGSNFRSKLIIWLKYLGLYQKLSREKEIPTVVLQQRRDKLALFLNRLFAGDGSLYSGVPPGHKRRVAKIEYCTTSGTLAQQLHALLTRFGIISSVYECRDRTNKRPYWRLIITRVDSIRIFLKEIGIFGRNDRMKEAKRLVSGRRTNSPLDVEGNILWSPIRKIDHVKAPSLAFDLAIAGNKTYLANGFVVHNSWCARRITEKVFGHAGIGIIDIEGEYSTLLELYPFLIIGRDVPVEPEAAAFLADEILKNKLSFIIDGSNPDLDVATFQEFITNFINRFIAIEARVKAPYLFILEEADQLIPEKGVGTSLCLEPLTRLVAKGGKRGLGTVIITQRPAFVSKRVISQATNKLIGHIEWPDDIAVLRKFGQIPESADIKNLKQGYFYAAGPFIKKSQVIHIGSVKTTHLGATPSVVPPIPSELKEVVAQLTAKLPAVIEEMKPAIPKTSEIEARLKGKFEEQWKVRLQRVEKQRDAIRVKTEAKYETEIADLKRKLDDAVRHATLKGGVSDLLSHPLVQKNLGKLNAKQRGFVELLETKGPQDSEHCSLFLEIKPKSVPVFVHDVNRKIPKLIENVRGRYASRLVKLFPVTEEAKVEAKEIEQLQGQVVTLQRQLDEAKILRPLLDEARKRLRELQAAPEFKTTPALPAENIVQPEQGPAIPVEVTLRRKLADFKVEVDREVLTVDESSWEGKILARGLDGFFNDPQGIGKIMGELVRRYGISESGGNRTTVGTRLTMLVSKGILDRRQEGKQWVYLATPEFRDRVKRAGVG